MKNLKSEKGSITLFVLFSTIFFIMFLTTAYIASTNTERAQQESIARTKEIYEKDYENREEIYNSYIEESLPTGHKQLEYIESTGTQYIDIGIIGKYGLSTYARLSVSNTTNENKVLLGSRSGGDTRIYLGYRQYNSTINIGYRTEITSSTTPVRNVISEYKYSLNNGYAKVVKDGVEILSQTIETNYTNNTNLYLFGNNYGGNLNNAISCKLYSFKLYDNGTLIRNLIPCLDTAGVPCMYDTVTKQSFYNAGTGEFKYKLKQGVLPTGYKQLEYIESTGTQYINTNIHPVNHRTEVEFEITSLVNRLGEPVFGVDQYVSGDSKHRYHFTIYNNKYYWAVTTGENNAGTYTTGKHRVIYNDTENNVYLDNELIGNTLGVNISEGNVLFGYRKANDLYFHGKYYSCVITDNLTEQIILNLIPVLDENDKPCMYDLVSKQSFYNQGTGDDFVAGPEV